MSSKGEERATLKEGQLIGRRASHIMKKSEGSEERR